MAVAPFVIGAAADAAEGGNAEVESAAAVKRHAGSPWYPQARQALDSFGERVAAAHDSAEMDRILLSILPFYLAHPDKPGMQETLDAVSGVLKGNLAAVQAWAVMSQTLPRRSEIKHRSPRHPRTGPRTSNRTGVDNEDKSDPEYDLPITDECSTVSNAVRCCILRRAAVGSGPQSGSGRSHPRRAARAGPR